MYNGNTDNNSVQCQTFLVGTSGAFTEASNLYTLSLLKATTTTNGTGSTAFDLLWTTNITFGDWDQVWNATLSGALTFTGFYESFANSVADSTNQTIQLPPYSSHATTTTPNATVSVSDCLTGYSNLPSFSTKQMVGSFLFNLFGVSLF